MGTLSAPCVAEALMGARRERPCLALLLGGESESLDCRGARCRSRVRACWGHRDIDGDRRRTVVDESLEDDDDDEEEEMIGAPRRKFD